MNDLDFVRIACENPWNDDPSFLAAVDNSERRQLLDDLQARDREMQASLQATIPPGLKEKLMAIPDQQPMPEPEASVSSVIRPSVWQWQKTLAMAASLVLVVGLVFTILPSSTNEAVANEVLAHIYAELPFLDSNASFSREDLDEHLGDYGGHFNSSIAANSLQATGFMECWIEKDQATHFHMVMPGEEGVVTVIIMDGDPVEGRLILDDARFDGVVLPTPRGNLVVAGEKGEPVESIANTLFAGIDW